MRHVLNLESISLIAFGMCLALPIIWAAFRIAAKPAADKDEPSQLYEKSTVLLYRNGVMIDANPSGLQLIGSLENEPEHWATLAEYLKPRFPGFPMAQGTGTERAVQAFSSVDPAKSSQVTLEQWDDFARIRITCTQRTPQNAESASINETALLAPYPIWISDASGAITWANERYMSLCHGLGHGQSGIQNLFTESFSPGAAQRVKLDATDDDDALWFDVSTRVNGQVQIHYASDANAIVRAEIAQRNFVQTLTKTFAQLSIGLAIFDVNRQLTLFNPALIDLTKLPADFLSSRPNLLAFFDRLRENRMIPEPKNYSSWRLQISELVVAAADDRYCETWSLPSDVTYKVYGRPHPDGAIALLFEDISAEVSLTRRFRSQLDLLQAAFDSLDTALVIFTPVGSEVFSNSAYRRFWKAGSDMSVSDTSMTEAIKEWQAHCEHSEVWDEIEEHLLDINPRPDLFRVVKTKEGRARDIRIIYLHGGNKAVIFSDFPGALRSGEETRIPSLETQAPCEEEAAV